MQNIPVLNVLTLLSDYKEGFKPEWYIIMNK